MLLPAAPRHNRRSSAVLMPQTARASTETETGPSYRAAPAMQALHRAGAASDGQLGAAELAATLRGFEAARGPRVARVYDMAMSLFRSSAGETWLGRLRRNWTFRWGWAAPASSAGLLGATALLTLLQL